MKFGPIQTDFEVILKDFDEILTFCVIGIYKNQLGIIRKFMFSTSKI